MANSKAISKKKHTRDAAVIYCRQSWEKEESISLEEQERASRKYCEERGYKIVDVIREQKTAKVWHRRKGVVRVMEMVDAGTANVVVIRRWNRLSRRRLHWALVEDQIEKAGGRVESVLEQVDAATAAGRLQRGMLIELSQYQADLIGEEWQASHAHRRRIGLPPCGRPRWGYHWIREGGAGTPERYVPDPDLAPVIHEMYNLYLSGYGTPRIAGWLNRQGVTTRLGNSWRSKSVTNFMDSGFSAGLLPVGRGNDSGGAEWIRWDDREWLPGAHQPIISAEIWDQYRAERTRRQTMAPRHISPAYPYSGLMRCGDCKSGMVRQPRTRLGLSAQLQCQRASDSGGSAARTVTTVEARVDAAVMTWLAHYADEIEAQAALAVVPPPARVVDGKTHAEKRLGDISAELEKLTRQHIRGVVPEEPFVAIRDELLKEASSLRALVDAATLDESRDAPSPAMIRDLIAEWETLTVLERRELLRSVVKEIRVYPPPKRHGRSPIRVVPLWPVA